MLDLVKHLPKQRDRSLACQLIALDFLHRRQIAQQRLMHGKLLSRLWRCWPYGAKVKWTGEGVRTKRDVCGMAWYCPWCLARKVVELYDHLRRGPLSDPDGKYLALARVSIRSNALGLRFFETLYRQEVQAIRLVFGERLQEYACSLGVTGGLITYQLGPTIGYPDDSDPVEKFDHELAIIGEVSAEQATTMKFKKSIGALDGRNAYPSSTLGKTPGGAPLAVVWSLLPADHPSALRLLLAGCGPGYRRRDLPLEMTQYCLYKDDFDRNGITGALRLQPLFMLGEERWSSYLDAVRNVRMVDSFGTWREELRSLGPSQKEAIPILSSQERALEKSNCQKHAQTANRRAQLLEESRQLWIEVTSGSASTRGRPAHKRLLGSMLKEKGHAVSDRDLRWLVAALKTP